MKHHLPILLAVAVSACSTAPRPAAGQAAPPEAQERTLEVSARATVARAPDRAVVRFAVETVAAAAREATARNAERMTAVLDALDRAGIDPSRVRTENVSLRPRFDRQPGVEPEITGYQASNQISVPVADVGRLGTVVDTGVEAGANRVLGIQFEIADPESAYHEALERAIELAHREAEVAAAALGETLGPPMHVSTDGLNAPPSENMQVMMRAQEAGTPIEPGELEVSAAVRITYRLGS